MRRSDEGCGEKGRDYIGRRSRRCFPMLLMGLMEFEICWGVLRLYD